mgnify:CR=1 FL=1
MKFAKSYLIDEVLEGEGLLQDIITGNGRWSIDHTIVFEFENKFYESNYRVGATEQQDESPYEYESDEIECPEVMPVEVTHIEYHRIKEVTNVIS